MQPMALINAISQPRARILCHACLHVTQLYVTRQTFGQQRNPAEKETDLPFQVNIFLVV